MWGSSSVGRELDMDSLGSRDHRPGVPCPTFTYESRDYRSPDAIILANTPGTGHQIAVPLALDVLGRIGWFAAGACSYLAVKFVTNFALLALRFYNSAQAQVLDRRKSPMSGALDNASRTPASVCTVPLAVWMLVVLAAMSPRLLRAQDDAAPAAEAEAEAEADPTNNQRTGRLLRLRLPITGAADSVFRSMVQRTKARLLAESKGDERPVIVIEFAPLAEGDGYGQGTDFTRALSLATYLTSDDLAGIKTVAYLPRTVKGHGVLVALACEEIAMAPTAEFGEAGIDEDLDRPVDRAVFEGYRQIAQARRTAPEAVVLGMVDPALEVLEVETEATIEFVPRDQLEQLEQDQTVIRTTPLFPAGTMGILSAREGRSMGAVKYIVESRDELAGYLRVPPESLSEDAGLVADWKPIFYTIDGPIAASTVSRARRLIDRELGLGANWVGLRLTSSGGNPAFAQDLATYVASIGSDEVRSIAYVPSEARGVAALTALSADQLVMHPTATLGGRDGEPLDEGKLESMRSAIRDSLAPNTSHTWSLLTALIDPDIQVYRYTNTQSGVERLYSEDEVAQQPDAGNWRQGPAITTEGEVLQLDGSTALELGIARHVVDNAEELNEVYAFESSPREVETTWSEEIAEALANPAIAVLLLVVAFAGIYFELHTPGLGIGGFVAAVALLLFFWSKALHGTVEWLEVLLFVGGVIAILIEVFVLPGVGIFGLGGALMVVASLVLAGQRVMIPRSAEEFAELQQSLAVVAISAGLMVAVAVVLRRYLPHIPILNEMMLSSVRGEELAELQYRESLAEYSHLVGHRGVTTTVLMPSGRADFDGELVDVIAKGQVIEKGATVEVTSARGSRVEVREVTG